ncbi:hypothetical protein ACFQZR_21185 [Paenibacillus sp. GCM10027629]|uniref:hypothetical protein n=1 Tax=Paenibacillus sp. GCM10027629 TaxID=3273414 RepID=UPI00363903B8
MKIPIKLIYIGLILSLAILPSCRSHMDSASLTNGQTSSKVQQSSDKEPAKLADTNQESGDPNDAIDQPSKNKIEISSSKDTKNTKDSKDSSKATKKQEEPAFDPQNPKLAGIALSESKDKITNKLGKPSDHYKMDDEDAPLEIYEYNGMSIGFNTSNTVEFVEVFQKEVATGLRGIRINQHADQVIKALGKPDRETDYVISYNAKDALLKLDVDPMTHLVQSIKLFQVTKAE